jgi:hypothetical protein
MTEPRRLNGPREITMGSAWDLLRNDVQDGGKFELEMLAFEACASAFVGFKSIVLSRLSQCCLVSIKSRLPPSAAWRRMDSVGRMPQLAGPVQGQGSHN